MKIEVKKIDATKRELKFEIPKDRVTKTMEEIYAEVGKGAKIKGFRPGKAPRHLVEAHYGKLVQEETIKKIIPEVYHEGIEKENISPIDLPEIEDVHFKDGVISFKAKLDIRPEVKIKDYKGIKITRKDSQVTDEEINKTLEFFKKGQGKEDLAIDDNFAKGLGFPGLEDFKNSLRRQLEVDKDRQNRLDLENQIIEHLLKEAALVVPQAAVEKQAEQRFAETRERLFSQGIQKEEFEKREADIRKDLRAASERDIKLYFIFDKIAELEGIKPEKSEHLTHKVMEFLMKEAQWTGESRLIV